MAAFLYGLVAWALGGAVARLLIGAGLTLVVFTGISAGVEALLSNAVTAISGLPADMLQLALLTGVGDSLSVLGAAVITRVALTMAGNVFGMKRT